MKDFIDYHDGIFDTQVRRVDGAGIVELHTAGECPRDCVMCAADTRPDDVEDDEA